MALDDPGSPAAGGMTVDDLFGALVAYEMYALASKRLPSITRLCKRRRLLCFPVATIVVAHLAAKETS